MIGFWSDWAYLNEILGKALAGIAPTSVTVIDPSDGVALKGKAPNLWALAHAPGVLFNHVQETAEVALDELHRAFSRGLLVQAAQFREGSTGGRAWRRGVRSGVVCASRI